MRNRIAIALTVVFLAGLPAFGQRASEPVVVKSKKQFCRYRVSIEGRHSTEPAVGIATMMVILFAAFPSYSGSLPAALNRGFNLQTEPSARVTAQQPTKAPITELDDVEQLRHMFQRDSGKVRLISLLSPT